MSKTNKVSATQVMTLIPADMIIKRNINGVEVEIKKTLSIEEKYSFTEYVLSIVSSGDGYDPTLFDFAVRTATILYFTNITLPQNINKQNALAYLSGIYEEVIASDVGTEAEALIEAAKERAELEYHNANDPWTKIIDMVSEYLNTGKEKLENIDVDKVNSAITRLHEIDQSAIIDSLRTDAVKDERS